MISFYFIILFLVKIVHVNTNIHLFQQEPSIQLKRHHLNKIKNGPCNIPIERGHITQNDFLKKYAYTSPVVFRRVSADYNSLFQEKSSLFNLLTVYGDTEIAVSRANTYSYSRRKMKFHEYISQNVVPLKGDNYLNIIENDHEDIDDKYLASRLKLGNETWYFFGENNQKEWSDLFDSYQKPKYELPQHDFAYSFGIAGLFSGYYLFVFCI
jgi:hypothetical protein